MNLTQGRVSRFSLLLLVMALQCGSLIAQDGGYRGSTQPQPYGGTSDSIDFQQVVFTSERMKYLTYTTAERLTYPTVPVRHEQHSYLHKLPPGPSTPATKPQDDKFNGDADVKGDNFDPGDSRDREGTPSIPGASGWTDITEAEYNEQLDAPENYSEKTEVWYEDEIVPGPPTFAWIGRYMTSNNDPLEPSTSATTGSPYSPTSGKSYLSTQKYGRDDGRGWEGDGANGVLAKSGSASWRVSGTSTEPEPDADGNPIPHDMDTAGMTWTEVRLQTNIAPPNGQEISRTFMVVEKTANTSGSTSECLGSITFTIASGSTLAANAVAHPSEGNEEKLSQMIDHVGGNAVVRLESKVSTIGETVTTNFLPVEFTDKDGNSLTGEGVSAINLVDEPDLGQYPDFAFAMSCRVALNNFYPEQGFQCTTPVTSLDEGGNQLDQLQATLAYDVTIGKTISKPILPQLSTQSIDGLLSLTGVCGGSVKDAPNYYNLYHHAEYNWAPILNAVGSVPAFRVECSNSGIQQQLNNVLVTGIQTNQYGSMWQEYVNTASQTDSKIFPAYNGTGLVSGVAEVVFAKFGYDDYVNGLADFHGSFNRIIGYSGGCETITDAALAGKVTAKRTDLFAPVLLSSRIQDAASLGQVTIHRQTGDWIGWLGFVEIGLQDIPSPVPGSPSMPGFFLQVKFGGSGNVQRVTDPGNHTHSGPNGVIPNIPDLVKP